MSNFNTSNFVRKQKITYEISYLVPKIIQYKFYSCHAIYQVSFPVKLNKFSCMRYAITT